MRMRLVLPLTVAVLLPAFSGCGTVNAVSTRTAPAADARTDLRVQINDVLTNIFLHCESVRLYRAEPSGLMETQVTVANDGFSNRTFGWRVIWLDARGNQIASKTNVWNVDSVPAGGTITLTDLAPSPLATDFNIELRRSDNS
jgi:hypothetical protein